ncbi:sensor histidine kinase [Parerythrobacter lacustris]|uniref:histidine kinase n=1 Tax=Parerythrobacter lacustris TaxID=2969984 RepID=A0ABT1XV03_9SPHN|nr:histidine kinase dimerization/phosphoacceptor domain -containing protein [Parerythrobacter lacustris]MCR2835087.1 histidine kinase [Parerythrobacter lacustris]
MEPIKAMKPESTGSLGMALVMSSSTPLILLNEELVVKAASGSFCRNFSIDCDGVVGKELFELGEGEWDIPQLKSLLKATAAGQAEIEAYEVDLVRPDQPTRNLVIHAHVLERHESEALRLAVAITDVTEALKSRRENDALVQEKQVLLQELNHRVANSLQIIASVLMQRVRIAQSEETRTHLRDAHHRVMSVATLQRQLASSATGEVALRPYFTDLCASIGASMIPDPALLFLVVDSDDSVTSADRSVSMGLIVTELVINSLKHAYPDEAKGTIRIGYHATDDGWILSVADDGVGIEGAHESGKPGLGTGIVNALAKQLKATVAVTDAHPGCIVSITHRNKM